ncbi:MAG: HPF/RaiA family ribosome-associated protein [Burkholderiales bacterium]|nr:HPF/RaiA family ribosome-associated protein [Burkholderiales bacterium]
MEHSDALDAVIRERAGRMAESYPDLLSCRVVVEEERLHQRQGHLYGVRLDLHLPGREFAVTRDKNEDPFVAVRDAFDAAKRKLDDELRVMRGDVKAKG